MKVSFSNLFDANEIIKKLLDQKIQGLDDFVKSIVDMNEKISQILRSNVSISDNIDCVTKTLSLSHNTLLTIDNPNPRKQVQHIVTTRALPFDNPVTSFAWAYNAKGSIDMKAQFLGAPTIPVTVTLIMYF